MADEIIAIGLACYDHLVVVPSLARVAEGCRVGRVLAQCGGVAATAAVAARRLGARVQLWTRVADDAYGGFVVDELRRRGVDTSQLTVVEGGATPVCTVLVEEGTGERRFLYFPGGALDEGCEPPDYVRIDRAAAVLVDGRWQGVSLAAVRRARAAGIPVVADIGHSRPEEVEILGLADYPVLSQVALGEILAGRGLEDFASELLERAARAVVVTRGAQGIWLKECGRAARRLGAFPVDVVDTTGAGDVFHGAFVCGVARGWEVERTAEFASAAASIACTALGGQTAVPVPAEVEKMLENPSRPHWEDDPGEGG